MSGADIQVWAGVIGTTVAAVLGIFQYFNYRTRRDRIASVGESFATTVEALSSDNETRRMAAAVLLRRFFDRNTEQGSAGAPYLRETIEIIAGMLRVEQPDQLRKVLADGLRFAVDLRGADLQRCDLRHAYLGVKKGDRRRLTLAGADLFQAQLGRASLRDVDAHGAVFYEARCEDAVFSGANLEHCDFREATLTSTRFDGARVGGARFAGATDVPDNVAAVLGSDGVAKPGAIVGER